jgi:hypothetical protein
MNDDENPRVAAIHLRVTGIRVKIPYLISITAFARSDRMALTGQCAKGDRG